MNDLPRNEQGLTEEEFLATYDADRYQKPSVTTDMVIFSVMDETVQENVRKLPEKHLKVVLVKRKDHPCIGQWALPGGFVDVTSNEDLDAAAYRELQEETGIDNVYAEQLYTWGEVERDPRMRVISVSYLALIDGKSVGLQAGSDAEDVAWFTLKDRLIRETKTMTEKGFILERYVGLELIQDGGTDTLSATIKVTFVREGHVTRVEREIVEQDGIAFDHARIIEYSLARLRNKIEYTDIVFNLMPELFTLTALQKVYETILGQELLKANFRRKVESMVVETNQMSQGGAFRPSKLFRFNHEGVRETF